MGVVWDWFTSRGRGKARGHQQELCRRVVGELRYRYALPWTKLWLYVERAGDQMLVDLYVQKDAQRALYKAVPDPVNQLFRDLLVDMMLDGQEGWRALTFSVDPEGQYALTPHYDADFDSSLAFRVRRRRWIAQTLGGAEIDYSSP
jgi:hypothetical protein